MAAGHFSSTTASFGGEVMIKAGAAYSFDAVLWNMSSDGTTLWAVRGGGTLSPCE